MIVRSDKHFLRLVFTTWPAFVFCVCSIFLGEWVLANSPFEYSVFSPAVLGFFLTAVGIFMVFRVNEAYDRWWEARKLWGALVNSSRYFAREVLTLVPAPMLDKSGDADEIRTELVHRHIAYVYAVGIALRHGPSINSDNAKEWSKISEFLEDDEFEFLGGVANIPTQLNAKQGHRLSEIFEASTEDAAGAILLTQIDNTLNDFLNIQGGCERIKNTEFPALVAFFTTIMVWTVAFLLPIGILDADGVIAPSEFVFLASMGYAFIAIDWLGKDLKRPFENKPNDTAMTALSRTIEIDLRQMLGEDDLPPALGAVDGVLM